MSNLHNKPMTTYAIFREDGRIELTYNGYKMVFLREEDFEDVVATNHIELEGTFEELSSSI